MKPDIVLRHRFVEFIPDTLEDGIVYVSMAYATVTHKCCCGCGEDVVTPLSPTDWKLTFDGRTISLNPSIGNWGFACQSHYWIRNNRVVWAQLMSADEIDAGRAYDRAAKGMYYSDFGITGVSPNTSETTDDVSHGGAWARLKAWWRN